MKINVKKVLFILVCAEFMIWYYGSLEVHHSPQPIVLQQDQPSQAKQTPITHPKHGLKKAS
ncbi:hypothetical protein [Paenibacillus cremeus]|uniref:Uncharacterized protein n=1 Tax=Paenibacillus cremeus TaxID=2163881 RepID=A0A559K3M1_9BACL|nr:hypothetical protein [Paenibacillus cremeus]TVY06670.1 hypothetical protein FPZ49_27890 [Paenibacillus cremeus]